MSDPKVIRHFVEGEFGQLHYRTAGEASTKPAVVCLHMVSKSSRLFHRILPLLGQDRLAIAIDYPGYGESEPPPDENTATIETYAQSVHQVLESLEIKNIDFIGYHTGAMVSVCFASQFPQLVRKVINISAPVMTNNEVDDFKAAFATIPLDEQGNRFRIMWERILFHRGPGMTLEMCADSMAENLRGGETYEWGHMAAFDHTEKYIQQVKSLSCPFIVMNLNDDLHEHCKRIDQYIVDGFRKDYMHWGAGFLDAYPEDVAQELKTFI